MSAEIDTLHRPFIRFLATTSGLAYTYHRPDQATGTTLGDADFAIYAQGRVLFIEFKDKETKVSKVQKERHADLLAIGCRVHVIRDLQPAIDLVLEWTRMAPELPTSPVVPTALWRWGDGVFRHENGGYRQIRIATPADANLPNLGCP